MSVSGASASTARCIARKRRLVNVDPIDLLRIGAGDGPRHRVRQNPIVEPLALRRGHDLRIADSRNVPPRIEHDRRRDDRPRQAAPAHFVHAATWTNPTRRSAFSSVRIAGTRVMGKLRESQKLKVKS